VLTGCVSHFFLSLELAVKSSQSHCEHGRFAIFCSLPIASLGRVRLEHWLAGSFPQNSDR
jgi:hypothetical protein